MAKKKDNDGSGSGSNLYERYRPRTFEQVIGHEDAVAGLSKIAMSDNPMHAIGLFGLRGGGKTTLGRIVAARLNCEDPNGAQPCGKCKECRAALSPKQGAQGSFREVDGSTLGKDGVAALAKAASVQTLSKHKVILIDEAHLISSAAGSALLKLVEEPPTGTVFIFCTTDEQRLLPALRSRMQKVQLNPLSAKDIARAIAKIAKKEGIEASKEDILNIATGATGSMREALVRLGNFRDGIPIDSTTITDDLVDAMVDDNLGEAFAVIVKAGTSINVQAVAEEIRESYRTALILKSSKSAAAVLMEGMPDNRREQVQGLSELTMGELTLGIRAFSEAMSLMRGSGSTSALLELAVTQALSPDERGAVRLMGDLMEELLDTLESLNIGATVQKAVEAATGNTGWVTTEEPESAQEAEDEEESEDDLPEDEGADSGADSDDSDADDEEDDEEDWEDSEESGDDEDWDDEEDEDDSEPHEDESDEGDGEEGDDEDPADSEDDDWDEESEDDLPEDDDDSDEGDSDPEDPDDEPEEDWDEDDEDWDEEEGDDDLDDESEDDPETLDDDEEDWDEESEDDLPEDDDDSDEGDSDPEDPDDEPEEDWDEDDEDWDEESEDDDLEEGEEDEALDDSEDSDDDEWDDDGDPDESDDDDWDDGEEDGDSIPEDALDRLYDKALELSKSKSGVKEGHFNNAYLQWADDGEGEFFYLVFEGEIGSDKMVNALKKVMKKAVEELGYALDFDVDFD